jgi:7,8-dihydropterin-6-yl-methyl-4-(beta-D-ribofuranosyl)aminobenzene 5'-phosphate synthase
VSAAPKQVGQIEFDRIERRDAGAALALQRGDDPPLPAAEPSMQDQNTSPSTPLPSDRPLTIGTLKRLRITCISEVGWQDTSTLLGDIAAAGGIQTDQYRLPWPPFGDLHAENAAGSSALIEAQTAAGQRHRVLLDTGWSPAWMERRFREEGVDRLLAEGAIDCLVISHEHFDHFWGIGVALKYCPTLPIYIPAGFHPEGLKLIVDCGHQGPLVTVPPQQPQVLFPGCALVQFPMQTLLQTTGENVLYFAVEGRGLVMATGCGHGGVLNLLDYARRVFVEGERIHAVYGGLHIAPFDDWDADKDRLIAALGGYGIERFGCNHCTGALAVERMIAAGLPVMRGTARHGSKTDLFLGNGDVMDLAAGSACAD